MTDFEIEYVKNHLDYLTTTYGINISHEDFIHDVDLASMVKDASIAAVNYQNLYKKYLKIISLEAYKIYFSLTDFYGEEKSYKKTVGNILFHYEIMMVSILKSSVFEDYNNFSIAEVLFAGMNQKKYVAEITPVVLPNSCYEEFKLKHQNPDYKKLSENLLIKMYEYKNSINKKMSFTRIAVLYTRILNEYKKTFNLARRLELKGTLRQFLKYMRASLGIKQSELTDKIKTKVNEKGNYTKSVCSILDVYSKANIFKDLRNQFETNEELLNESIKAFNKSVQNGEGLVEAPSPFVNELFSEDKEGGNSNV